MNEDSAGRTDRTAIERLSEESRTELQNAHEKKAMELAVEDGELSEERAHKLLDMDELAVVQSEYYPGDEYYDRAAAHLERQL